MSDSVSVVVPRLEPRLWGGHALEAFGVGLADGESIGEARMAAGDARVIAGRGAGRTLDEIVPPNTALASGEAPVFPLLIKLIDARQALSIQVHPDDTAAAPLRATGKTEAWHVLAARPGSVVLAGLRNGVSVDALAEAAGTGDPPVATMLRSIPVTAGMTLLIPAGTVHAIGAGVVVYEIQQPSEITYRLHDWGRIGADGRPRDLHVADALAATRPEHRPEPIRPLHLRVAIGTRHLLAACRYFALERIALPAGGTVVLSPASEPRVVVLIAGEAVLGDHRLRPGVAGVIWRHGEPVALTAVSPVVALTGWVPDLARDVIGPSRLAGATGDAIAALAGPLDDLGTLL